MDPNSTEDGADEVVYKFIGRDGFSSKFDCKFIVGESNKVETVYGCKRIFAVESPVFERMLFGDFQGAQNSTDIISLQDDDPKVLRHFRLIACSGDRESCINGLSLDDTINLTQFCLKYMALSITRLCTNRLISLCENLRKEDVIKLFLVARLFPQSRLLETAVNKLKKDLPLKEIPNDLSQEAFKDCLHYLCADGNYLSSEIFEKLERYLRHNDLIPDNELDVEETSDQKIKKRKVDVVEISSNSSFCEPDTTYF